MFLEAEAGADLAKLEVGVESAAAVAPDPVLVVLLRLVATHLDTGYSIIIPDIVSHLDTGSINTMRS